MTTNYERIKQMSVEQMAEWLYDYTSVCKMCEENFHFLDDNTDCMQDCPVDEKTYKQWLESEAEDG